MVKAKNNPIRGEKASIGETDLKALALAVKSWGQELGFQVIPTVSWSTPESFDFCFAGLPRQSLAAVSAQGVRLDEPVERERFMAGYREMVARLSPSTVLAYGHLPEEACALAPVVTYPTRWDSRLHAHRRVT